MKIIIAIFLLTLPTLALADWFYVMAQYECDKENDNLRISYHGPYNEAGEKMIDNLPENVWNPWDLIIPNKDGSRIKDIKTITAVPLT